MELKNREVLALAAKRTKFSKTKVIEFGITPDWTVDQIADKAVELAKIKAKKTREDYKDLIKGQELWLQGLVQFSKFETADEALESEYDKCFMDVASEVEIHDKLDQLWAS